MKTINYWIRIQMRIQIRIQPILFKQIWKLLKSTHLKFNQKEEFTNDLPFSISYYSPTVWVPLHTV